MQTSRRTNDYLNRGHFTKFLGLLLVSCMISCGNDQKTSASKVNDEMINLPRTDKYPKNSRDSLDRTGNRIDSLDKDNRTAKMFADLNFSEEEMEQYRTLAREERDNWEKTNANGSIDQKEHLRMERVVMKNLLNQERFGQYQEWLRTNPYN